MCLGLMGSRARCRPLRDRGCLAREPDLERRWFLVEVERAAEGRVAGRGLGFVVALPLPERLAAEVGCFSTCCEDGLDGEADVFVASGAVDLSRVLARYLEREVTGAFAVRWCSPASTCGLEEVGGPALPRS